MDKLISAEYLIAEANKEGAYGYVDAYQIANAPEGVVRCKDCKWNTDWDGKLGCGWHGFYETGSDWFCADGERSENGKVD